jgi:CheY-like chemotaxis protein
VTSGKEALDVFRSGQRFSLVLMDWSMPGEDGKGMNGLECAREIRRAEKGTGRRVPIIAVTAHAMLGDQRQCLEAGMDDYLSKPFTFEQFRDKVNKWLSRANRRTG